MSHLTKVKTVNILISDWGEWTAPDDLTELHDKAPKVLLSGNWGSAPYREVPDRRSKIGKAYYERERELLNAIGVIEQAGIRRLTP